jgi:hypothetical protein
MTAVPIVCVVLKGIPKCEAMRMDTLAAVSAATEKPAPCVVYA